MSEESAANENPPGWGALWRGGTRQSIILVSLAVWLHASMATAISTLIPGIVAEVHGLALVPWAFSLYEIGSIVAGAGSGLLVYRYHLRAPMLVAAVAFALGSSLCALAPAMPALLVGRLIQGLGGGGLIALSFIGIGRLFSAALIPRAMATVSAVWGGSAFLGPIIGGLFVEHLSWRLAFLSFSTLALALAVWIICKVPDRVAGGERASSHRFPLWRIFLLSLGVVLIAMAGIHVDRIGTPFLVCAGMACLVWFLRMDGSKQDDRLLPESPLGLREPVSAGLTTILCFTLATMAITVYGPLFMVHIHGVSLITAGYIVACSSIGWSLAAIAVSGVDESSDRRCILSGALLLLFSVVGLLVFISRGPLLLLAGLALIEGAGFGVAWAAILRRMLRLSRDVDRERVPAAIPTIQRLGYAVGAAWIGIVANAMGLDVGAPIDSIRITATWVFAACLPFALLGLLAAIRFTTFGRVAGN